MLSLRLSGWLSLRLDARAFRALLFHDPPRNTRARTGLPHGPVLLARGAIVQLPSPMSPEKFARRFAARQ